MVPPILSTDTKISEIAMQADAINRNPNQKQEM